ncbi:MAG: hypothetical protein DHS20C21_19520 [Gemmatimonadota bacterium]|nr:MAG: hypothetical protein DHS20C21_19520 [Gemmatimonadota bacterium]
MRDALLVARREFRFLASSAVLWVLAAAYHLWNGLTYRRLVADHVEQSRLALDAGGLPSVGLSDAVLAPLLLGAAFGLILFVPLLTMNALSADRRAGFEDLMASLPLSSASWGLGKALAMVAATLVLTLPLGGLILVLSPTAPLEWGVVWAGVLGLVLAGAAYACLGVWASSLAGHPLVAAVTTITLLLVLFFVDRFWAPGTGWSLRLAFDPFTRGVVSLHAVGLHLAVAILFVFLTVQGLELRRRTR